MELKKWNRISEMSSHNLDLSSMVPSNMPYPVHRIKIRYGINLKGKADSFGICITSRVKIIKPIINHRDPYSSFFIIQPYYPWDILGAMIGVFLGISPQSVFNISSFGWLFNNACRIKYQLGASFERILRFNEETHGLTFLTIFLVLFFPNNWYHFIMEKKI